MKFIYSRLAGVLWLIEIAPWFYFMYGLVGGTLATLGTISMVILRGRQ